MRPALCLILSTSPPAQTGGKPPGLQSLRCRKRLPCRGLRYRPVVKELDAETGLYYYGARYLDPKTSRWLSGDPAMGEYIPSAPVNDEAKKRNGSLPGMGGVFNHVNLHVYHYAGNNPVIYIDPDGETPRSSISLQNGYMQANYQEMDNDVGFSSRITIGVTDGMQLMIAPGTTVQMRIEGLVKNIYIKNSGESFFIMDVNATVDTLAGILLPAQTRAFSEMSENYEIARKSYFNLTGAILIAIGGLFISDPSQAIGEALAGNTIHDIEMYSESIRDAVTAMNIIYKDITIEVGN